MKIRKQRQKELEEYQEMLVKKHQVQEQARNAEIEALKGQAEAQKNIIFQKLCEEEAERRAQAEYIENLRNELSA